MEHGRRSRSRLSAKFMAIYGFVGARSRCRKRCTLFDRLALLVAVLPVRRTGSVELLCAFYEQLGCS